MEESQSLRFACISVPVVASSKQNEPLCGPIFGGKKVSLLPGNMQSLVQIVH